MKKRAISLDKNKILEPNLRELSAEEYSYIMGLKKTKNYSKIENLTKQIRTHFLDLEKCSDDEIKIMFENAHDAPFNLFLDIRENSDLINEEMVKFINSPLAYLNNNVFPIYKHKLSKTWTERENERLIALCKGATVKINFAMLSLCFPGRSGKQIHSHYRDLISKGIIQENQDFIQSNNENLIKFHFIDDSESKIAEEIKEDIANGKQIDKDTVIRKAECYYYEPWNLAKRVAFQNFVENKKQIYKDDDNEEYSEEFTNFAKEIQSIVDDLNDIKKTLIEKFPDDPKIKYENANEVLRRFNVPKPVFSSTWITDFMKRNRLSWRKAHYSRRASIDNDYASLYINLVAEAVCSYTWDFVFNMDETSVRINNGSIRTIAPIGLDEIVINAKRNDKECFTAIGTCTRNNVKKLIILTKGTEKSCAKFKANKDIEVWPTNNDNGWVNEEIMLRYLDYIHGMTQGTPCALILDVFKAHHTLNVIKRANELNIQLIFVPANGTSIFQPLDRKIFGIVKSKLRKFARSDIYSGSERFEIITQHLLKAWNEIPNCKDALKSAWDIPDLNRRIEKLSYSPNALLEDFFRRQDIEIDQSDDENIEFFNDDAFFEDDSEFNE